MIAYQLAATLGNGGVGARFSRFRFSSLLLARPARHDRMTAGALAR
jgi:hypothetical protein